MFNTPNYPKLGAKVARLRNKKPYLAWEHGLAVLEAIRDLQKRELQRRRAKPDHVLREQYEEAMREKRAYERNMRRSLA